MSKRMSCQGVRKISEGEHLQEVVYYGHAIKAEFDLNYLMSCGLCKANASLTGKVLCERLVYHCLFTASL
jgi:hypothetical protein